MVNRRIRWLAWWRQRSQEQQALRYERLAGRLFIIADTLDSTGQVQQAYAFRDAAYRFRVHALCHWAAAGAYNPGEPHARRQGIRL